MSIPLENGRNEIEMSYKVPYIDTGLWVSALGLLLFAAVLALSSATFKKLGRLLASALYTA